MAEQFNKRLYPIRDFYRFIYDFIRTIKYTRKAEKSGLISKDFVERIMLTVTEVNGCEVCSYYHAADALKQGISQEEINSMLAGESEGIPNEQSIALFFAQHYADSKGYPTKEAWNRVLESYGKKKAFAILGSIRAIMVGNTYGIAAGALSNRFKGKNVKKSNLGYETGMVLSLIPFVPTAFIHSLISNVRKKPLISFE